MKTIKKEQLEQMLQSESARLYGCDLNDAVPRQIYQIVSLTVRNLLMEARRDYAKRCEESNGKQVYYMSMEFLPGTSLRNHLYNMELTEVFRSVLHEFDVELDSLFELEPDAGLGNGGLGRLVSCYMDSLTSLSYPVTGFSIRYEFGIFKQKIVDGWQMEFPDDWLDMGGVWLNPRTDESYEVHFGGYVENRWEDGRLQPVHLDYETVIAVPYDMMVSGHATDAVNRLVLWSAKSPHSFDMSAFSRGDYAKALEEKNKAEVITKVLYPADDHVKGKLLRLRQQYLLVSASMQSVLRKHFEMYQTFDNLPEKAAIHINDTHPSLCVPELLRILMDEHGYSWDGAWDIACRTLTYTNHTVMSEALERWPADLFRQVMPRIYEIVCEINRRLYISLHEVYHDDEKKLAYMAVVANQEVRMANLCLSACHKVNGVSKLHTEILKNSVFHDYYYIEPEKFLNVTNGIACRRWLCQANPALAELVSGLIGPEFAHDFSKLEGLLRYRDDNIVLESLERIKYENKVRLCAYIAQSNGIHADPSSIFDVQIKRLHEYKRQLLNALHILLLYHRLKTNTGFDLFPRTFLFAAKASPGYFMAKQVISLVSAISKLCNSDPVSRGKLCVVFLEDYKVSLAEKIIPAAELSEQISVAGKEASGTGNMKLMLNGAVTIGTLDGANVEICEQVGRENMFLFGMEAHEVEALWKKGYRPQEFVENNQELKAVLDMLVSGILGAKFEEIHRSLLTDAFGTADAYMALADFDSYQMAQQRAGEVYADRRLFLQMSLTNIAKSGIFSADRSVREYCDHIWNVKQV